MTDELNDSTGVVLCVQDPVHIPTEDASRPTLTPPPSSGKTVASYRFHSLRQS